MNITISDDNILIEVPDGCITCPFSKENECGCDKVVVPTHDYNYPIKCPLLDKKVIVERKITEDKGQ